MGAAAVCSRPPPREFVFVGCYTEAGSADPFEEKMGGIPHDRSKKGKGIYIFELKENGALVPIICVPAGINPSYLSIDKDKRTLFVTNENSEFMGMEGTGSIRSFRIMRNSPSIANPLNWNKPYTLGLEELSVRPSLGSAPCHVLHHPTSPYIFTCNYAGANISVYEVLPGGIIGELCCIQNIEGSGPDPHRQKASHPHCTAITSPEEILISDLGVDEVHRFMFNEETGLLKRVGSRGEIKLPPGSGPRQVVANGFSNQIHVILEMKSRIETFSLNETESGDFKPEADTETKTSNPTSTSPTECKDLYPKVEAPAETKASNAKQQEASEYPEIREGQAKGKAEDKTTDRAENKTENKTTTEKKAEKEDKCGEEEDDGDASDEGWIPVGSYEWKHEEKQGVDILPSDWPEKSKPFPGAAYYSDGSKYKKYNGGKWASALVTARNGSVLYAANRLHNSIAVIFKDEDTGKLSVEQHCPCGGVTPRDITLNSTGELLLVANQHSHNITVFPVLSSGRLKPIGVTMEVPLPSCIKTFTL